MSKLGNELTMLELLANGKKYSISELANILEVSERMVRIYKDDAEKAGIYIDTIYGPYGGYVLNQKYSFAQKKI
jgi:predicted DNA-binding transcriptional regulator YafY